MWDVSKYVVSNDDFYIAERCRTLPIPASISPVPGYPAKLRIYLTNASPYWQAKCFFKGKTYSRSLRTSSKRLAIYAARDFFHSKAAEIYGATFIERDSKNEKKHLFRSIAAQALAVEEARSKRGELSTTGYRIFRTRLNKFILPVFGDMAVEDVGYSELANFIGKLSNEGNSSTTLQQYCVAIRKVLNHAQSLNLIQHIPSFPKVKIKINPRGDFNVREYLRILRTAKQCAGEEIAIKTTAKSARGVNVTDRYLTIPYEMVWLIGFMVNSFIRPSDLKTLQHQHVHIVRGEHIYLRLNLPETKKHDKPIVTMQPAVRIYEKLLASAARQGLAKPADYLFFAHQPDRKKAIEQMGFAFQHIMKLAL